MKQKEIVFGVLGLIVGILFAILVLNKNVTTNQSLVNRNSSIPRSEEIDAHFIEQMIPHHEDAITMSKIALTKASRDEVRKLAQNIIDSQSREIEQMKKWYIEWFERDLPTGDQVMMHHGMQGNTGMHMGMMGDETDLQSLENAQDFDREFVKQMIPHHQMAVMMASMLKNGTNRDEMKKLADDIIKAQTDEIDMMRKWLREW